MLKFLQRKRSIPEDPYAPYSPERSLSPQSNGSLPYGSSFPTSGVQNGYNPSLRSSPSPSRPTDSPSSSRGDLPLPTPLYARFARSASGTDLRLDFLDEDPTMGRSVRSAADSYAQSWHRGRSGLGKQLQTDEDERSSGAGPVQSPIKGKESRRSKDLPPPPAMSPTSPSSPSATVRGLAGPSSYNPLQPSRSSTDGSERRPSLTRSLSDQYKTEEFVHPAPSNAARQHRPSRTGQPTNHETAPVEQNLVSPASQEAEYMRTPERRSSREPNPPKSKLTKPSPRSDSLQRFGSPKDVYAPSFGKTTQEKVGAGEDRDGRNGQSRGPGRQMEGLDNSPPRSTLRSASSQFQRPSHEQGLSQTSSPAREGQVRPAQMHVDLSQPAAQQPADYPGRPAPAGWMAQPVAEAQQPIPYPTQPRSPVEGGYPVRPRQKVYQAQRPLAPETTPQPMQAPSSVPPTPLTPPHSPTEQRRSFLFVSGGKVEPMYRGNVPVSPPSGPPSGSPTTPLSPASSTAQTSGPKKLLKKRGSSRAGSADFPAIDTAALRPLEGAAVSPSLTSKRSFAPGSFRGPAPTSSAPPPSKGVLGFVRRLSESRSSQAGGATVSAAAQEAQVRIREGRRKSQVEASDVDELRRMLERDAAASMTGVGAGRRSLDAYGHSRTPYNAGPYSPQASGSTAHVNRLGESVPGRGTTDRGKGGPPPQAFGMYGQGRRAASEVDLRHVPSEPAPAVPLARENMTLSSSEFPLKSKRGFPSVSSHFVASPVEDDPQFSGEHTPTSAHALRQAGTSAAGIGRTASPATRYPPGSKSSGTLDVPSGRGSPSPSGSSRSDVRRSIADSTRLGASSAASVYSQESLDKERRTDGGNINPHLTGLPVDVVSLEATSAREAIGRKANGSTQARESLYKSPYLPSELSASEYGDALEDEKEDKELTPTRTIASTSAVPPLNDTNRPLGSSPSTLRRTPARRQSTSSSTEDLTLRSSARGPRDINRPERDTKAAAMPTATRTQLSSPAPAVASTDSFNGSEIHGNGASKGAAISKASSSASSYIASSETGPATSSTTNLSSPPTSRHRVDAGAQKPTMIPFPKSPDRQNGHTRRPSDPRYKLPPPRTVPPPVITAHTPEERGPQKLFLPDILAEPGILRQLLVYLSFRDFLVTEHVNRTTRAMLGDTRNLREIILERYLDLVGYRRWPRHLKRDEPITLSLKDLNAYLMGVSVATYQYANAAETYLQSQTRDPAVLSMCRSFTAATRSYTRVVLRLRAQAEAGWDTDELRSPLFRLGHAPLLRVFVPSPNGGWLSDESVVECEKELRRAGVMKLVRRGDVVWDSAVSDEGNIGRLIWDGNYLLDLEYDYSASGQLPHYFNSLAHPPSYWHKVIRTTANPIAFIDLRPYGKEIMQNVQLVQDRVQAETPQGGFHTIVRYSHRSVARVLRGVPIPDTKEVVDGAWDGRIVVEAEGTNEGLADLQARCSPQGGKGVYRILREKSRPGEVWIRCVRPEEKIM